MDSHKSKDRAHEQEAQTSAVGTEEKLEAKTSDKEVAETEEETSLNKDGSQNPSA